MGALLKVTGGDRLECSIATDAAEDRNRCLGDLRKCEAIEDELDAEHAATVLRTSKAFLARVESARKEVKAPFLDFGRRIDGVALDLTHILAKEQSRVARLLGGWEAEQRRKAEAIERERRRQEAEAREKARREAEESARHAESTTEEQIIRKEAREAAKAEVAEIRKEAAAVAPLKTSGVKLRSSWEIEVLDVESLFKAHPELVDLVPNLPKIRKALTAGVNLPGVKAEKVQNAS